MVFRVSLQGFDSRHRDAFAAVFARNAQGRYQLVSDEAAQISVIDVDAAEQAGGVQRTRRIYPGRPLLLVSREPAELPGSGPVRAIRKPLVISEFLAALETLSGQIAEPPAAPPAAGYQAAYHAAPQEGEADETDRDIHLCGAGQDVDLGDAAQLAGLFYDPRQYLPYRLSKARASAGIQGRLLRLEGLQQPLYLEPRGQCFYTALSERMLRGYCMNPLDGELREAAVDEAELTAGAGRLQAYPAATLLWKAAMWSARGRLPTGTPLDVPVWMRRWPNLTRYALTPHALRICALWVRQPHSLIDTVRVLGATQRHVFALYSAAVFCGYAGLSTRQADRIFAPEAIAASPQRGLFQKLMGRFAG